jgi:hypothetical protein
VLMTHVSQIKKGDGRKLTHTASVLPIPVPWYSSGTPPSVVYSVQLYIVLRIEQPVVAYQVLSDYSTRRSFALQNQQRQHVEYILLSSLIPYIHRKARKNYVTPFKILDPQIVIQ